MLATKVEIGRTKTFGRRTALIILSNSRRVCVVLLSFCCLRLSNNCNPSGAESGNNPWASRRAHSLTRPSLAFVTSLLSTNPRGRRARHSRYRHQSAEGTVRLLPYSGTDDSELRSILTTPVLRSGLVRGEGGGGAQTQIIPEFPNFKKVELERFPNYKVESRADQLSKILNGLPCTFLMKRVFFLSKWDLL